MKKIALKLLIAILIIAFLYGGYIAFTKFNKKTVVAPPPPVENVKEVFVDPVEYPPAAENSTTDAEGNVVSDGANALGGGEIILEISEDELAEKLNESNTSNTSD